MGNRGLGAKRKGGVRRPRVRSGFGDSKYTGQADPRVNFASGIMCLQWQTTMRHISLVSLDHFNVSIRLDTFVNGVNGKGVRHHRVWSVKTREGSHRHNEYQCCQSYQVWKVLKCSKSGCC